MERLSWGQDGDGRCHLCCDDTNLSQEVIFCGLHGIGGQQLIWLYEDFGPNSEAHHTALSTAQPEGEV